MRIPFRQGIVTYPISGTQQNFLVPAGTYVSLSATNGRTDVAFAHGIEDYLLTESETVQNAWGPLPINTDCWLYWDIDKRTAARTFGITLHRPIIQANPPHSPSNDQHWFDTTRSTMYVYISGGFREVIRVFAAKFNNNTFSPMGYGFAQRSYAGTQVGLSQSSVFAGRILVDDTGSPLRRSSGHFFTTEHNFFVDGSPVNILRLESAILTGTAQYENLHAYQVVTFAEFGEIGHARYNDIQTSAIAILLEDLNRYDTGTVCIQGHITNPDWNWSIVGAPLWIDDTGALIEYDPHVSSPLLYPQGKSPVARVVTQNSIIFDQGLGGKGDAGTGGGGADVGLSTTDNFGVIKLSVAAVDAQEPVAVGTNDPRMTDARTPLAHTHVSSAIIPTPYGSLTGSNLQLVLQQMEDGKVAKSGDTMSGSLTLFGTPTLDQHAATKLYVDTKIDTKLDKAGGVMTGYLTLSSGPSNALHAATKEYVDDTVSTAVNGLAIPYDVAFFVPDNPFNPTSTVSGFLLPRSINIDTTDPQVAIATCTTVPIDIAGSTFELHLNGSLIATISFLQGSNLGTVIWGSSTYDLYRGDILTLVTTSSVDPTIAGIGITVTGCSTATPCTTIVGS